MLFNISQLLREPSGFTREYEVNEEVAVAGDNLVCSMVGRLKLMRTDDGVWVSAPLDTVIPGSCSRCLVDTRKALHLEIEEEFLTEFDLNSGARVHTPREFDENFYIGQNRVLDLTEAVNQYIYINTSMKNMCRPDCKGLCMTCGINLNEGECKCDRTVRDPRWGTLLDMVTVQKDNG
ncbi:MAG: DUF177 domain-containing protein [Chloroflexi bacterium]|nr:DUF177 domain-containing protein [Chloroflexota bacterium]